MMRTMADSGEDEEYLLQTDSNCHQPSVEGCEVCPLTSLDTRRGRGLNLFAEFMLISSRLIPVYTQTFHNNKIIISALHYLSQSLGKIHDRTWIKFLLIEMYHQYYQCNSFSRILNDFYIFSFDEDIGFTRATLGNLVGEDVDPFLFSYNLFSIRALA